MSSVLTHTADAVGTLLRERGFALSAPVAAAWRRAESGSTGIHVTVELEDAAKAGAAKVAILAYVGAEDRPDLVRVTGTGAG